MPTSAIKRLAKQFFNTAKVSRKITKKQVKLPTTDFPPVNGILVLPNILPTRLAKPSPAPSAKIPIAAGVGSKINAVSNTPAHKVTGPNTKRFSSRLRAAAAVTADITGTFFPCIRKVSAMQYKTKTTLKPIITGR